MSENVFSGTVSRRSFLKAGAFTAAVVALANGGYELRWPEEAFADQDSPEEVRYTYCDMCNQVPKCGIKATVKEGKIVRVEARKDGWPNTPICSKGLASLQELYDPHRLLYPMKRTNPTKSRDEDPGWERIGWDEAYDTIAQHMLDAKEKYGAESVMLYCGDPKEPRGAINRLANLFGTPTNSNESSCCMMAAQMGTAMVFGERSVGADPTETSKSCLIWSLNPAWSMAYRFGNLLRAKDNGTKFIVVDPRITPTVESLADIHLQPRPGTDGALALGIAHVMLRDGLYDAAFCEEWVLGFEEFRAYVQDFTPEKVEEITWVPADKIEAAAQMWGQETPGAFITSAAPTVHGSNAGNTQRAICSLVALAGNLDVTGGLPINAGLPFTAFADTMAFERVDLYGKGGLQAKRFDAEDFPVWAYFNKNMQANRFPEYIDEGKIKVMMMWGGNAMMWPQSDVYQKAIGKLEFSAAADYYIRPWTHNFMDIVLPVAMCYERMAPFAVFGRKIYLREPVVPPAGEAREDYQIVFELGCRLGLEEDCFGGSVEAALENILQTTGLGITLQDLRDHPEGYVVPSDGKPTDRKYATGGIRSDGQPGFNTPSGKVEFLCQVMKECGWPDDELLPRYKEPVYSPVSTPDLAKDYPLVLNTGSRVPMYTHSKLRDCPWLNQFMPEPIVRLHPRDAEERGLQEGDMVRVFNQLGEVSAKLEVTNLVLPGVIDMFHGWEDANVNKLVSRDFDPVTGYPPYKEGLCQVERA